MKKSSKHGSATPDVNAPRDPISSVIAEVRRDPTDSLVEDLSQQDVLPTVEGSMDPNDSETLTGAITQAGQWDEPVADLGHRVNKQPLEDEVNASEELVNKGIEEADEELRELDELDDQEEEEEDVK